jgi:hypothetical protein
MLERKKNPKGMQSNMKKDLPFSPAALHFLGDKSWLDSPKDPFIQRMSHGPTPLKIMIENT